MIENGVDLRDHFGARPRSFDDNAGELADIGVARGTLLNIQKDAIPEKLNLGDTQRAMINILEDAADEKTRLEDMQRAMLNILEDDAGDKARDAEVQRAVLNIIDDFDIERRKAEQANEELRTEVAERARAEKALRRANDATERLSKELEAFSYSVAHDLRAPLRSIDGFSQALLEDCAESLPADGKTYLGYVRESAQHMARLIDDLLALSRLGRAEVKRSRIDLAAIARTIYIRLQRDNPNRSVELIVPAALDAEGDPALLEVVFENLLGNAWKFTGKRANAIIEVGRIYQDERPVFFVRDNGAGFDMAYAGKLFAVFQRLHAVREFDGTGIGLATVERIIRRHRGRIWGEGEVDRGATFYFTLEEAI
jgi:light-regulated signal transduction histidine kinase (bacteriophytochrome)